MITADRLAEEILRRLEEHTEEVEDALDRTKNDLAKEAVAELKATSPKDHGEYAGSWTRRKRGTKIIVHNRKHYQLTHLLEKGHALWQGGRSPAKVHIAPVEKKVQREAISKLKRNLP